MYHLCNLRTRSLILEPPRPASRRGWSRDMVENKKIDKWSNCASEESTEEVDGWLVGHHEMHWNIIAQILLHWWWLGPAYHQRCVLLTIMMLLDGQWLRRWYITSTWKSGPDRWYVFLSSIIYFPRAHKDLPFCTHTRCHGHPRVLTTTATATMWSCNNILLTPWFIIWLNCWTYRELFNGRLLLVKRGKRSRKMHRLKNCIPLLCVNCFRCKKLGCSSVHPCEWFD